MSLSLIQSYSSADEEEDQVKDFTSSDEDDDTRNTSGRGRLLSYKSVYEQQSANLSASNSGLPSASDAFTQISGPPKFLNNIVEEQQGSAIDVENQTWRHGRHRRNRKNKKELPAASFLKCRY